MCSSVGSSINFVCGGMLEARLNGELMSCVVL